MEGITGLLKTGKLILLCVKSGSILLLARKIEWHGTSLFTLCSSGKFCNFEYSSSSSVHLIFSLIDKFISRFERSTLNTIKQPDL